MNELAIIVAALFAVAVGSIWYSPLVCGKFWVSAKGGEEVVNASENTLTWMTVRAVIAVGVLFTLMALLGEHVETTHPTVFVIAITLGILLTHLALVTLWEQKRFSYLLIHGGYAVLAVSLGYTVIMYWPW